MFSMEMEDPRLILPNLPPAPVRARQRERFFGADRTWHTAILTPISAIYDALPSGRPLAGGWWPSKEWKGVLICATPQASAIMDALCALESTTRVLFLGLAGSLGGYSIGDIVEASTTLLDGVKYRPGSGSSGLYPYVTAVTVRCLNESFDRRDEISSQAHVVDMESAWVCAMAEQHERESRVVLIVSDELHGTSFLTSELAAIDTSISLVAAHAAEYVIEV